MLGGDVKPIRGTADMLIRMSVAANNKPQVRSVAAPLNVTEMTVAVLKKELSARGVCDKGKKAVLQVRLMACMEDELEEEGGEEGGEGNNRDGLLEAEGVGEHELEADQAGSSDSPPLSNLWDMIQQAWADQYRLVLMPDTLVFCAEQEGSLCGAHAVDNFSQRPLPRNLLPQASQEHKARLVHDAGSTDEERRSLQNDVDLPRVWRQQIFRPRR